MTRRVRITTTRKFGFARFPGNSRSWRGYHVGMLIVAIFGPNRR